MLSRFSHIGLCATLWTTARQAPLSMGFSRQEYWTGLPCPLPGDLPDLGVKFASFTSLMSPELAGGFFTTSATWEALIAACSIIFFSCDMWDLVPWLEIEPRPPALGAQILNHCPTRAVPQLGYFLLTSSSILTSPHSSMKGRVSRIFTLQHRGRFFFCVPN